MANIGEITEIVNASELTLEVGANTYVALTDLEIVVSRPEDRSATTDLGAIYTYGKGDNFFTATLNVTTPEISTLNTLSQTDANGALTSTAWLIVAKDVSGNTKTFSATGVLRDYRIRKPEEGKVKIDIFVRITGDTVTVS
jgi:hypothetical protein